MHDPGELDLLFLGEVFAGSSKARNGSSSPRWRGHCPGGPEHRVQAVREYVGLRFAVPLCGRRSRRPPSAETCVISAERSGPNASKKLPRVALSCPGGRPNQTAAVVVDDHGQIFVSAFVGNLVDTDPGQVGELVVQSLGISPNPGDDRPERAPRDPHQLRDRRLGGLRG